MTLAQRATAGVVGVVAFVIAAEVWVRAADIGSFPTPSAVLERSFELVVSTDFLAQVGSTLLTWLVGLTIALGIGATLGLAMGYLAPLRHAIQGPLELIRPLPAVAIAPLLLVLYGRGTLTRALAVAFAAVWPILYNAMTAMRSLDPIAVETGRSLGLSPVAVLRRVAVPTVAPFVFTGLRVASGIALIVAVGVEFLFPDGTGLGGFVLRESAGGGDLPTVYGTLVVAGLLGIATDAILAVSGRRLFPWAAP